MIVGFLMMGVISGLSAGLATLILGHGVLLAFLAYVLTGTLCLLAAVLMIALRPGPGERLADQDAAADMTRDLASA